MRKFLPLGVLLFLPLCAQETRLYVSPGGNDSATGKTVGDPLATIEKALALADPSSPTRIVLQSGRYELAAPIRIGSRYNGLTVEAAPGASPVLSGGRRISGFVPDPANGEIWRVPLPAVREGKWYFRQLFVNGKRMVRARTPNDGYFRIEGESPQEGPFRLKFKSGDIKREWASRGDVEVVALLAWSDIRMQIREVNDAERVAVLSGNPRPSNKEANAQYWVENAAEFLDSPGEWYLDRKTGVLSYWRKPGEDLNSGEVIAPVLEDLMMMEGTSNAPVQNVTFNGLRFAHTDWQLGDRGYADTQAAVGIPGDVRATFAEDVTVTNCVFEHLAGYGLELRMGCKRWSVQANEFYDLGAGGIRIGETTKPRNASEENNSHRLFDNHLHELGRVYAPAVGLLIFHSGTNHVAHNHIHDLYYTAISVGWNWGYQETPCRANVIEFNHLHDIGKGILSDMGGIYTLGPQPGTVLRNNLIHDVSAFTYGGWGLYTDEGSTAILLENNVVYRCKSAGFHQHYGKENIVRNNIFAFNREHQLMRTRPEPHTSFIFTNNIVYFDSGDLLGSNWSNDHYVIDGNVYYDTRARDDLSKMKFTTGTLEQWQARGHDQHSIIEDPQFVAPEKFDFRLKAESPALKLGFRPIDLSKVGVRK